jgi:hypothetical protein
MLQQRPSSRGRIVFTPRKNKRCVDSFLSWLTAWNGYESLVVTAKPHMYAELTKYRHFIQMCANKFQWSAVYAYDCRLRASLAQSGCQTFAVDSDLYTAIFDITAVRRDGRACHRCKSRDHFVSDCLFPASDKVETNAQTSRNPQAPRHTKPDVCFNYNQGRCNFASCKRAHMCESCGCLEPMYRCPCSYRGQTNFAQRGLENMSRPPPRPYPGQ